LQDLGTIVSGRLDLQPQRPTAAIQPHKPCPLISPKDALRSKHGRGLEHFSTLLLAKSICERTQAALCNCSLPYQVMLYVCLCVEGKNMSDSAARGHLVELEDHEQC